MGGHGLHRGCFGPHPACHARPHGTVVGAHNPHFEYFLNIFLNILAGKFKKYSDFIFSKN